MWGVTARLTPFLEMGTFFNAANFALKVSDVSNTTVVASTLKVLICPSETTLNLSRARAAAAQSP